jgi:hypothetical protein
MKGNCPDSVYFPAHTTLHTGDLAQRQAQLEPKTTVAHDSPVLLLGQQNVRFDVVHTSLKRFLRDFWLGLFLEMLPWCILQMFALWAIPCISAYHARACVIQRLRCPCPFSECKGRCFTQLILRGIVDPLVQPLRVLFSR